MSHKSAWKPVTKRDTISRLLVYHRQIADEIGVRTYAQKLGIKPGTLSRYLTGGWEPKSTIIRARLGLPELALARVCPIHGKVCAVQHRLPKITRWRDLPIAELRRAIENRKDYR